MSNSAIFPMPLQKPSFQSKIPDYLLLEASPKEKFILEQLSIIGQGQDWIMDETTKQSSKLEDLDGKITEVDDKLRFTNGKIGNAMIQIKALEDKNTASKESEDELKKILVVKNWIWKLFSSKLFWTVSTVTTILLVKSGFFSLLFQWLSNHMGIQ
jgi:hypothetical protein